VVTAILFILMGALVALIIALLSPRHMIEVREDDLAKERQDIQRERRRAKDLQRKVNQELRKGK
jgi:F0F1-type ATP synthase membrane subunit b/b'